MTGRALEEILMLGEEQAFRIGLEAGKHGTHVAELPPPLDPFFADAIGCCVGEGIHATGCSSLREARQMGELGL